MFNSRLTVHSPACSLERDSEREREGERQRERRERRERKSERRRGRETGEGVKAHKTLISVTRAPTFFHDTRGWTHPCLGM